MIGDVHVPRNLTSIGGGGAMRTSIIAPLFFAFLRHVSQGRISFVPLVCLPSCFANTGLRSKTKLRTM